MLTEADSSTVENPLISKQILNSAGGRRFRRRFLFVIACNWLREQRLRLLDILVQVIGLAPVIAIEPSDCQETGQVVALAKQVGDFLELFKRLIGVTVDEHGKDSLHVICHCVLVVNVGS